MVIYGNVTAALEKMSVNGAYYAKGREKEFTRYTSSTVSIVCVLPFKLKFKDKTCVLFHLSEIK